MTAKPITTPKMVSGRASTPLPPSFRALDIRSKQTTASITPAAKLSRRLTCFFESRLRNALITPPIPVPPTPAMAVIRST